ncbi:MAG TPA: hypothetical protein VFP37_08860 [Steroidobacteraceae bacterium]|nr:hypothetical protein [Steroidobacteraceae bacterium]
MFSWFGRARDYYFSLSRPKFEAMTLGLAALTGLLIMPGLIYLAGRYTLREYANGGALALYVDFFKGLFEPRPSCWIVVAGPLVFLCFLRFCRFLLRKV